MWERVWKVRDAYGGELLEGLAGELEQKGNGEDVKDEERGKKVVEEGVRGEGERKI